MNNKAFIISSCLLIICLILLYGIFINPTIYRYDQIKRGDMEVLVKSNRLTGKSEYLSPTYSWVEIKGNIPTPSPTVSPTPKSNTTTLADRIISTKAPVDISKLSIAGDTFNINTYEHKITGTVKNDDTIAHYIKVKAIYYDVNKNPIATEDSSAVRIAPGQLGGFTITQTNNITKIKSYELQIVP